MDAIAIVVLDHLCDLTYAIRQDAADPMKREGIGHVISLLESAMSLLIDHEDRDPDQGPPEGFVAG